ncbi:MAG TPA: group I intron-associated PD-(D/E)XK endonuclease [Egibacteraceae bacterium]|nr:group I intron-associated PD-(D/E)XK endonuclease [Egibacteraceae bacterium]
MTIRRSNPGKQGEIGLGAAIAWFLGEGYGVSVPLCDNQPYDLIIDSKADGLQKVQVKTSTRRGPIRELPGSTKSDSHDSVQICTRGGNQSFHTVKYWDPEASDLLFILSDDGDIYVIPSRDVTTRTTINLCEKYERYRRARWHIPETAQQMVVGGGFEPP